MKLDSIHIRRLGIFVFYDKEGIVDDYVIFLLKDICKCLDKLSIICNGVLTPDGRRKLEEFSDDIYVRPNLGYDIAAWKYAITKHFSKVELASFDELVLFNDTFYGPFESFSNIFATMNKRDVDFWGLTAHRESVDNAFDSEYGYRPCFIQSFFSVFRKKLISSLEFYDFWNSIRDDYSYEEAVNCYENVFAQKFLDMGFKWETYINTDELFTNKENSMCYNTYMPNYMLRTKKLPIIRRKVFVFPYSDYLEHSSGETILDSLNYIRENTNYDEGFIWKNLLRLYNIADLRNNMKLNYVLPSNVRTHSQTQSKLRIAVILHLYYTDILNITAEYVRNIPSNIDIYITTNSDSKATIIREYFEDMRANIKVLVVENRGRDVAALLVDCSKFIKDYDLFCFTHDKKTSSGSIGGFSVGNSFMHIVLENTIKNSFYINNVIDFFEQNPYVGLASVPSPVHSIYFGAIGDEWTSNYEETIKLSKRLKLELNLDRDKPPFVLGTAFWARTEALLPLFEYGFEHEDFHDEPLPADGTMSHALERIMPYIAQKQGYYSCWVMTDEYARVEISNTRYMLSNIVNTQQKRLAIRELSYSRFIQHLSQDTILQQMPNVLGDPLNKIGLCAKLYLKLDNKYSEQNAIYTRYYPNVDGTFLVVFNINIHKSCTEFRFDPIDYRRCLIRIDRLTVNNKMIDSFTHNGLDVEDKYQFFNHIDPSYFFGTEEHVTQISIMGRISILDDGIVSTIYGKLKKSLCSPVSKLRLKLHKETR